MAEYVPGSVLGLSTLRTGEGDKQVPKELSAEAKQRQEYLKRYLDGTGTGTGDGGGAGGKRKKKKRRKGDGAGELLNCSAPRIDQHQHRPVLRLPESTRGPHKDC